MKVILQASGPVPESVPASGPAAPAPRPVVAAPSAPPEPAEVQAAVGEAVEEHAARMIEIGQALRDLNLHVLGQGVDLHFRMAEESSRVVISIVDSETGQVVREIPPEEAQRLAALARSGAISLLDATV